MGKTGASSLLSEKTWFHCALLINKQRISGLIPQYTHTHTHSLTHLHDCTRSNIHIQLSNSAYPLTRKPQVHVIDLMSDLQKDERAGNVGFPLRVNYTGWRSVVWFKKHTDSASNWCIDATLKQFTFSSSVHCLSPSRSKTAPTTQCWGRQEPVLYCT